MANFIDENGIQDFIDENGITLFIDENGIFLGTGGGGPELLAGIGLFTLTGYALASASTTTFSVATFSMTITGQSFPLTTVLNQR